MAILVNEVTAAGSEIVATALRDHNRAKILGTRTFGQETIATIFPLGGNSALKLTTARLFGPDGKSVAPVTPDIVLEKSEIPPAAYGSPDDAQVIQAIKSIAGEPLLVR
jgi:carboxyl-terminal processing protease